MTNTRLFLSSLGVFILCLICCFLFGGSYAAWHFWRSGIHDNFGHVEHSYFESVSYLVSDFEVLTNHLWGGHLVRFKIHISNAELTWSRFKCEQNCSYLPLGWMFLIRYYTLKAVKRCTQIWAYLWATHKNSYSRSIQFWICPYSLLSMAFRGGHLDHAHTGDCTKVS